MLGDNSSAREEMRITEGARERERVRPEILFAVIVILLAVAVIAALAPQNHRQFEVKNRDTTTMDSVPGQKGMTTSGSREATITTAEVEVVVVGKTARQDDRK